MLSHSMMTYPSLPGKTWGAHRGAREQLRAVRAIGAKSPAKSASTPQPRSPSRSCNAVGIRLTDIRSRPTRAVAIKVAEKSQRPL